MYQIVKSYSNVHQFAVGKNQLYAINGKQLFDLKGNRCLAEFDNTLQFLRSGMKFFRLNDSSGNGYLLDNGTIEFFPNQFIYIEISENTFVCFNNNETYLFSLDSQTKSKILDFNISLYHYENDTLYFRNNSLIQKQSIYSIQTDWQFDLNTIDKYKVWGEDKVQEIGYFIGVYQNVLWVSLLSNQLLGLDISNGAVKFHLTGVEQSNSIGNIDDSGDIVDGKYCIWNTKYFIDYEAGIMRGSYNERYYEMDLKSENPQMIIFGLMDQLKEFGIDNIFRFSKQSIQVGNEFFMMNVHEKKFVIIDIATKKVVYVSEPVTVPGAEKSRLQDFQIYENKIYLTDSFLNLYEYERVR